MQWQHSIARRRSLCKNHASMCVHTMESVDKQQLHGMRLDRSTKLMQHSAIQTTHKRVDWCRD